MFDLRILTWNVNRVEGSNYQTILGHLQEERPDVAFLSEISARNPIACDGQNAAECLARDLEYQYISKIALPQRESGVTWDLGDAMLIRNGIQVVNSEIVFLSGIEQYRRKKEEAVVDSKIVVPMYEPRLGMFAELKDHDRVFAFCAAHLGYSPFFNNDSPVRGQQSTILLSRQAEYTRRQIPRFVVGDLNMVGEEFATFLKTSGLINSEGGQASSLQPSWVKQGGAASRERLGAAAIAKEGLSEAHLDYILHSTEITRCAIRMPNWDGSDHFPLIGNFTFS